MVYYYLYKTTKQYQPVLIQPLFLLLDTHDSPRVCTLDEYQNCTVGTMGMFSLLILAKKSLFTKFNNGSRRLRKTRFTTTHLSTLFQQMK